MMQKSSLSNFCLTNYVRNLKVFLEVHGRDIDFAKLEQSYNLTSTDAEAAAIRLLLVLYTCILFLAVVYRGPHGRLAFFFAKCVTL